MPRRTWVLRRRGGRQLPAPACSSAPRLLAHLEGLDNVADLDVAVVAERETALEALTDLDHVVLEPPQRADRQVLGDHHVVAQQAATRVAADLTGDHERTGDRAEPGGLEDLADLGPAELDLLELRLEQALECLLDLLDGLVDHRVVADLHALAGGELGGLALGPDVEPEHDGIGRRGQVDIALSDATDTAVDHPELDLLAHVDLQERVLEGLDGTRVVALDDQVELAGLLERGVQVLQADALAPARQLGVALAGAAPVGDLAGHPVLVHDEERVARAWHRGEPDDLH